MNRLALHSLAALATLSAASAATPVDLAFAIDPARPTSAIPGDFAGLSYERNQLLPAADGSRYFRADNAALLRYFRNLGIRSLRIGGNASDRDAGPPPSDEDIDHLFAFAKAADAKVIYSLQLHGGDPQENARLVRRILDRHAAQVDYFSIGQEPSAYPVKKIDDRPKLERMGAGAEHYPYEDYRELWRRHHAAIVAVAPEARFAGPAVHSNAEWSRRFTEDFGSGHGVVALLGHLYPCGNGKRVADPAEGRRRLLSDAVFKTYQEMHDSLAPFAAAASLSWRIEETNSFWNGGAAGASDTAAAALWGLDYLHWWAARGCGGINFHTGDTIMSGAGPLPASYSAFVTSSSGYTARPLAYALAAFALANRGAALPVTPSGIAGDVRVHAVLAPDDSIFVTLIHMEDAASAAPARIALSVPGARTPAVMRLAIPEGDVSATAGLSLGGASIQEHGSWDGRWESLPAADPDGLRVLLPPASAAIVRFAPSR